MPGTPSPDFPQPGPNQGQSAPEGAASPQQGFLNEPIPKSVTSEQAGIGQPGERMRVVNKGVMPESGSVGVAVPDLIPGIGDLGFYPNTGSTAPAEPGQFGDRNRVVNKGGIAEWRWPEANAEQVEEMRRAVREYVKDRLGVKDTADLKPDFRAGMEAALEAMQAARQRLNEGQSPGK